MKNKILFGLILFMMPIVASANTSAKVRINDVEYETLDEAVEQVKSGETIVLLDDIDVTDPAKYGKYHNWLFPDNTTLDLNGYTITTGRINGTQTAGGTPNAVWLGNDLTIKNGTFISRYKASDSDTIMEGDYALFLGDEIETSNITVENVTVSTGINIYNTTNVTLKNVTSIGKAYYAVWLDEHATATIESGNYSTKGVAVVGVTSTDEFVSQLTIKGGIFEANKGKLSLSEGGNSKYQPPIIQGGTYDFDVTEFIADEYECKENNGKYIVNAKQYDRDVTVNGNVKDLSFTFDNEKIAQIFRDTINTTKEININGKDVEVILNLDEANPKEDIKKAMIEKIEDAHITNYFDIKIDVIDKNTQQAIGQLTKINNSIALELTVPENMKPQDGFTRVYYILREHDGIIDILNPTLSKDNKTLTFETDKFSTYALAYKDVENSKIENPNTGDNIKNIIFQVSFLIIIITGCIAYLNRRKIFNK